MRTLMWLLHILVMWWWHWVNNGEMLLLSRNFLGYITIHVFHTYTVCVYIYKYIYENTHKIYTYVMYVFAYIYTQTHMHIHTCTREREISEPNLMPVTSQTCLYKSVLVFSCWKISFKKGNSSNLHMLKSTRSIKCIFLKKIWRGIPYIKSNEQQSGCILF